MNRMRPQLPAVCISARQHEKPIPPTTGPQNQENIGENKHSEDGHRTESPSENVNNMPSDDSGMFQPFSTSEEIESIVNETGHSVIKPAVIMMDSFAEAAASELFFAVPNESELNGNQSGDNDVKPNIFHIAMDSFTNAAMSQLFCGPSDESQSIVDPLDLASSFSFNELESSLPRENDSSDVSGNFAFANRSLVRVAIEGMNDSISLATKESESTQVGFDDQNIEETVILDDSIEMTFNPKEILRPMPADEPKFMIKANDLLCGNIPFKSLNVSIGNELIKH